MVDAAVTVVNRKYSANKSRDNGKKRQLEVNVYLHLRARDA